MTIAVELNNISLSGANLNTAATNINTNSALIETGFSSALNIAGDQMQGNIDMNSNQILNLPAPAGANSPARLVDIISASTAITVPPLGTSGAVVGLLNNNLTFSGNNTFTGTNTLGAITATTITSSGAVSFGGNITGPSLTITGTSNFDGVVSLTGGVAGIRQPLTGATNLYVNGTTGNDSNTGTISAPFKTISGAVTYIQKNIDFFGSSIILNVAAGTYAEQVSITNPWIGNATLKIQGAGSASTTIQAPSGDYCVYAKDYGTVQLAGLTLSCASGGAGCLLAAQFGVIDILGGDIVFGSASTGVHVSASQCGSINLTSNYSITGNAAAHIAVSHNGMITTSGSPIATISSALAFTEFVSIGYGGVLNLGLGWTSTGAGVAGTTGVKFVMSGNSECQTNGTDLNSLFPGSSSGAYYISQGGDATPLNTLTSLSAVTVKGDIAVITDATATTQNSAVTGGGAITVLAWYNGSAWKIIAS